MSFLPMFTNIGYGGDYRNTIAQQQGLVVLNARVDIPRFSNLVKCEGNKATFTKFYDKVLTEKEYAINQGDILLRELDPMDRKLYNTQRKRTRYDGSTMDNGAPLVFGCLNGAGISHLKGDEMTWSQLTTDEEKKAFIRSQFEFVGVAQNDHDFSAGALQGDSRRVDLSVQIGGVNTQINQGKDSILAGQEVMWDAPEPSGLEHYHPRTAVSVAGKSKHTVQPATVPFVPGEILSMKTLYRHHVEVCKSYDDSFGKDEERKRLIYSMLYAPMHKNVYLPYSIGQYYNDLVRLVVGLDAAIATVKHADFGFAENIKSDTTNVLSDMASIGEIPSEANGIDTDFANKTFKKVLITVGALFSEFHAVKIPDDKKTFKEYTDAVFPRFLNSGFNVLNEARSRIIGKALTSAAPGHQFDMVLAMNRTA